MSQTVFLILDLKQSFHQIELEENSRYITTLFVNKGLYRYKVLNFGIYTFVNHKVYIICEGIIFLYKICDRGNISTPKFILRFAYKGSEYLQIDR